MKINKLIFLLSLIINLTVNPNEIKTNLYFCTAADSKYFDRLLNLIGSIHETNFENLSEIAVFNLGLSDKQLDTLKRIQKLNIYEVEQTNPEILKQFRTSHADKMVPGWYTWKPVVIKQSLDLFPYVLWIDAGATVLKPLDDLFKHIKQNGYFIITVGDNTTNGKWDHPVEWQTTKHLINKFNINLPHKKWILSQEAVTSAIIGVSKQNVNDFIMPLYILSKDLRNFEDDGSTIAGFGTARHDQSLLTILAYLSGLKISTQDYTQNCPTYLNVNNKEIPFYITWNSSFVSSKTHIYSSRVDISKLNHYLTCIKYKNLSEKSY